MSDALVVGLPGRIAVVPSTKLAGKLAESRQQGRHLPDPAELIAEINQLNANGGVPATAGKWFRLYAQRHQLGLRASQNGDAWVIEFIAPLKLSDHEQLARGVLRLRARDGWLYQPVLAQLPKGFRSFADDIQQAWQSLSAMAHDPSRPSRPIHHDAFCDDLTDVIEAARQIEAATQQDIPPIPYYDVEATAAARHDTGGRYVFRLASAAQIGKGTSVAVRSAPDLRGWVTDLDGDRLTVNFADSVHQPRIPAQGELVVSINVRVQQIQRAAVEALRAGRTPNPRLLGLLADTVLPPARPSIRVNSLPPGETLDPDQTQALLRAMADPDLLLVLGPPGTGKTRTIGEIARAMVARGERVLVSSQTHVAVDNVLERLADDVRTVRVGSEDRVAQRVRHLTVPSLAESVRASIRQRTTPSMNLLEAWRSETGPPAAWLARLGKALNETQRAQTEHDSAARDREIALNAVKSAYGPAARQAATARDTALAGLTAGQSRVADLTGALDRARSREGSWLRWFYRRRALRLVDRLAAAQTTAADTYESVAQAQTTLDHIERAFTQAEHNDPGISAAQARMDAAAILAADGLAQAGDAADALHRFLVPHGLSGHIPSRRLPELQAAYAHASEVRMLLGRRANLLSQWRERLDQPSKELNHELVRYADVVGTTCIGVGVERNYIADQTFDVAIVDEAGQISLPTVLVPLVRARRVILVGDHHQLPPFVENDVLHWLAQRPAIRDGADPGVLTDLLTTSAFERLHRAGGAPHTVTLTRQRRMPAVVAEFVSRHFYDNQLRTMVTRTPPDELFTSCLALIDTSDQTPAKRAERQRQHTETWQAAGYDNPTEARLIVDLMQRYTRTRQTWAVIVPYRAQMQYLKARLTEMLGSQAAVNDNVGTVDAFQGGERDVVVYGFTRSNAGGRVGFLSELRRLNVALTRARQQLVLIGDFTTLRAARDPDFAQLAQALYTYAQQHGDVQPSMAVRTRLRQLRPAQS